MSPRRATRDDHERFCVTEGWLIVRNARGKPVRHHQTYELALDDGSSLRTRISRPVDRTTYGAGMWNHILTEQLQVTGEEFWACVDIGVVPPRGKAAPPAIERAIPASLVHQLITQVGLGEAEVMSMTRQQAIEAMQDYWSSPT